MQFTFQVWLTSLFMACERKLARVVSSDFRAVESCRSNLELQEQSRFAGAISGLP
jgi:hypothetical protein